jgi:hypothetical protein
MTFRLVTKCLKQLRYRAPLTEHGRREMKITRSEDRVFVTEQTYFSANNDMQ